MLASQYADGIQLRLLNGEDVINNGAIYENAVAQELFAHGFKLYYYNNKKRGELDFVVECNGEVLPLEVKSGKDYALHRALSNVMDVEAYHLRKAYVLSNSNIKSEDKVVYLPVYMAMFIENTSLPDELVYEPDLSLLN